MKKLGVFTILLFGLALACSSAYAASGETNKQEKNRPEKLAVLDLEAKHGVEDSIAEAYSVLIRDEIHSYGEYEVMSTADLRAVMSREAMLQAMGCDDDGSACLVNFGRAIGTRFMVAGSLSKLGSTYNISLRILDTKGENAGVVKRASGSCKCSEDELIAAVQQTAAELMGKETLEIKRAREAAERKGLAAKKRKAAEAEKQRFITQAEGKRKAEEKRRIEEQVIIGEKQRKAAEVKKQRLLSQAEEKRKTEEKNRIEEQKNIAERQRNAAEELERQKSEWQVRISKGFKSGDTFTDPISGVEFVYVLGGCFQMGCNNIKSASLPSQPKLANLPYWQWPLLAVATILPTGCASRPYSPSHYKTGCYKDEQPVHEVCVDGFFIGKYEVTQGEYQKVMGSNPSRFDIGSNYPVEKVSWNDTQSFISKLNNRTSKHFRLPTEAEWEYAARSGGKREEYSGSNSPDSVAWYASNSNRSTHGVGKKFPNGFGLYDMSGNVWEWCSDWSGSEYYSSRVRNNPQGPYSGSYRVLRGGSWLNNPRDARPANRSRADPSYRNDNLGFRLVLSEGN